MAKLRRNALPYKIKQPGDLVQIDGVEGYHLGHHYYVINAIDYISGKATSAVLANKSSLSTANFLRELNARLGFKAKAIQTDNGSEYAAKFHQAAERLGIKHCFNYVKKPIYNGKVERFKTVLSKRLSSRMKTSWSIWWKINKKPTTPLSHIWTSITMNVLT